jgi:excisionase family DNA binding protein
MNSNVPGIPVSDGRGDVAAMLDGRDALMTVADVARALHVSTKSIYRLIRARRLPSVRIGTAVRLDGHTVARWLRETTA